MRALPKVLVAAAVVGVSAVPLSTPAGAAVVTTVTGNTIAVTVTGMTTIHFGCAASKVTVNTVATSPTLACNLLTKVTVNGDASDQQVYGSDLKAAAFTANPNLVASTNAGYDYVVGTDRADTINTGAEDDTFVLELPGLVDTSVTLGTGSDRLIVRGSNADETIQSSSTTSTNTISFNGPGGTTVHPVLLVESLTIEGSGGEDLLTAAAVSAASTTDSIQLRGGDDDDQLVASPIGTRMLGYGGHNTFTGAAGNDIIESYSDTDTIKPGGGTNTITDDVSLHSGGRTVTNGTDDTWLLGDYSGDSIARIRPNGESGASTLVASLTRNGIQALPATVSHIEIELEQKEEPDSRSLVDLVAFAGDTEVVVYGDEAANDLVDLTIPNGTWTTTHADGGTQIFPNWPGYGDVAAYDAIMSAHPNWGSANQSFAHRVVRDLLFRFPTTAQRNALQAQLDGGTSTRAQLALALTSTDEYRGLDVDRVFLKFLHRVSDPGGRTYWINSLRNGKSLTRFRAQLFGSNEYFTKAGATNASYMVKAYEDVLGRKPDLSGQTYWTNKLDDGADRGAVALQFLASTEARRNIVRDQFLRFVDRYPSIGELDTWIPPLDANGGEQALIRFLTASTGYYTRN